MRSKRSLEGEVFIDHRASPGLSAEDMAGFPVPAVGKGEIYESALIVCSHCQYCVILDPKRTRERGWCSRCDRYVCDDCDVEMRKTLECKSADRQIDQMLENLDRYGSVSPLLLK